MDAALPDFKQLGNARSIQSHNRIWTSSIVSLIIGRIMKWKSFILASVFLMSFVAGYKYWKNRPTQQDVIQQVFGNQQNFEVFTTSPQVTAQLLHLKRETRSFGKLKGYVSDTPIQLSSAQARQVRRLLQTPSSFKFSRAKKACIPDYGILFAFRSNQKIVSVALCFNCDILGVFDSDYENAESINSEADFDPVHGKFTAIAKSIFPNDPTVQSLK